MGRKADHNPRAFYHDRITRAGQPVFQAGIRFAYNKRVFLGTFVSKADAEGAVAYYLANSTPPPPEMFVNTKRGPRPGQKYPRMEGPKDYTIVNPKPPQPKPEKPPKPRSAPTPRPKREKHVQPAPAPAAGSGETRIQMLKRIYSTKFLT